MRLARRLSEVAQREDPGFSDTLAAAYAAVGQFAEAVTAAEKALRLAQVAGQTALARQIESRLELYRSDRPYRRR